jgi:hypothetical protein
MNMNTTQSIIAIRKVDVNAADNLFAELMNKTEKILNQQALIHVKEYRNLSPTALEEISHKTIQLACQNTPFNPNNVILVSGHKFPDIVADGFYGVEVKSTNKNHWTSTGSSIVESTRIDSVANIYMLFGKLGGNPPEFKCRPYQDVLCDIAVTHCPRYLIDMELEQGKTIFDKIDYPYDKLRNSPDAIEKVKQYYKKQAKQQGGRMPWWIDEATPIPMNIRLWNTLSLSDREELKAQILVLFPEVVNSDYSNAAMWLASAKGVVDPSFRDRFTAGGRIYLVNGKETKEGLPKIWKTISDHYGIVKKYLTKDSSILPYIREYNPDLFESHDMQGHWLEQIDSLLLPQTINKTIYTISELLKKDIILG